MSYEIIYGRAFIKVDNDRTIPILEMGSNNCYDVSGRNPKRARDWSNDCYFANSKNGLVMDNEALIKAIDEFRGERIERANDYVKEHGNSWAYDDKQFGYHSSIAFYGKSTASTTFTMFKNYYLNGIKTAKTIEEYQAIGIRYHIHVYCFNREEEFTNKNIEYKGRVTFETTEQMLATISEFSNYYNPLGYTFYIGANITDWSKRQLKTKRIKKAKTLKVVSEIWVLNCKEVNGYFVKNGRRSYRYAYNHLGAKKFETEKQAGAFHKRMRNKDKFEVEKIANETPIYSLYV